MVTEILYTYDDELNTIKAYSRQDIIDRINDYIINFEEKDDQDDCLIKDGTNYTYNDFIDKLGKTYSREHLFLVTDTNNNVLFRNGQELNK